MDAITFDRWAYLVIQDVWNVSRRFDRDGSNALGLNGEVLFNRGDFAVMDVKHCVEVCVNVLSGIAMFYAETPHEDSLEYHQVNALGAMLLTDVVFPSFSEATRIYAGRIIGCRMQASGPVPAEVKS